MGVGLHCVKGDQLVDRFLYSLYLYKCKREVVLRTPTTCLVINSSAIKIDVFMPVIIISTLEAVSGTSHGCQRAKPTSRVRVTQLRCCKQVLEFDCKTL